MARLLAILLCSGAVVWCAPIDNQTTIKSAEVWLTQYKLLGGDAALRLPPGGAPALAVTKITGQKPLVGLKGLKPPQGMKHIGLQGYEINDDDLAALMDWKDLETIMVIDGKKVGDKGVKAIAMLPNLRDIDLTDTGVTGTGVDAFSRHASLAHFRLSNTIIESRVNVFNLEGMPKLETILLSCERITTFRLAKMPRLRQVDAFPFSLEAAELSDLDEIVELDFRGTKLKKLSLSGTPKLRLLDVRETGLDKKTVAELKLAHPTLQVKAD